MSPAEGMGLGTRGGNRLPTHPHQQLTLGIGASCAPCGLTGCLYGGTVRLFPRSGCSWAPWLLKVDTRPEKALKRQRRPGGTRVSAKYQVTSGTPGIHGAYVMPPGRENRERPPNQPLPDQGAVPRACELHSREQRDQQGCCGKERGPGQGRAGGGEPGDPPRGRSRLCPTSSCQFSGPVPASTSQEHRRMEPTLLTRLPGHSVIALQHGRPTLSMMSPPTPNTLTTHTQGPHFPSGCLRTVVSGRLTPR